MFSIIRILIGCVLFFCFAIIARKGITAHKRLGYIVTLCVSVISVFLLSFWPFEDLFITFDSPETAYAYYTGDKSDVALVVNGDGCDLVVGRQNGSDTHLIVPKTEGGWKTGIGWHTKKIHQQFSNGILVCVYQYNNTRDYFITILNTNGGETYVSDNRHTKFCPLETSNDSGTEPFVTYYAHIMDFDSRYSTTVNGNKIGFENP